VEIVGFNPECKFQGLDLLWLLTYPVLSVKPSGGSEWFWLCLFIKLLVLALKC